jgi:hypothetical protein
MMEACPNKSVRARFEEVFKASPYALAIADRLTAADPANAGYQRDLSISHNKLGDLAVAVGDTRTAEQHYRAQLAIAERVGRRRPSQRRTPARPGLRPATPGRTPLPRPSAADPVDALARASAALPPQLYPPSPETPDTARTPPRTTDHDEQGSAR